MELRFKTSTTDLTIGVGDYLIEPPIEGLAMPTIRTSSQLYSGRDGGRVNVQFYNPRLISLQGHINENTCTNLEQSRIDLQNALRAKVETQLIITTPAGNTYTTFGRITDFNMDYESYIYSRFRVDYLCNDVYFLETVENTQTVERYAGGGGFILPVILPIIFGGGVGDEQIINGGTEVVYPVIKIYGAASNPTITAIDTGEKFGFDLNIFTGDVVEIDMYNRTATLNGDSIMSYRSDDSTWWGLQPGTNMVRFTTSDGDDTGYADVIWRNAILTI